MESRSIVFGGIRPMAAEQYDLRSIVKNAQSGDLDAFELLIRRHERQVLGLCRHMLGNVEDAKDASQDVFLKLYQQIGRFDYLRDFTPWLLTVVMNQCRDRLRRRRPMAELGPLTDVASSPEKLALFSQEWVLLKQAIASLPEREREALELRELEELSSAEVAARLGVTEETVRSQVSKAKAKLRKLFRRQA